MNSTTTLPPPAETRFDPYPSRSTDFWTLLPRIEEVCASLEAPGPLSTTALQQFARDGFLIQPGLLDHATLQPFSAAAAALPAAELESDRDETEGVIREPGSRAVRSIFAIHQRHPDFWALAGLPVLAETARQLLGTGVYLHQSRINYKPGFVGKEFWWHSDFETWHCEDGMPRMRAVSCVVCLSENTALNGPLLLIPGSHQHYVRPSARLRRITIGSR